MSPKLKYIHTIKLNSDCWTLSVQFEDGGAAQQFDARDTPLAVADKLIEFAHLIANDAKERELKRPLP